MQKISALEQINHAWFVVALFSQAVDKDALHRDGAGNPQWQPAGDWARKVMDSKKFVRTAEASPYMVTARFNCPVRYAGVSLLAKSDADLAPVSIDDKLLWVSGCGAPGGFQEEWPPMPDADVAAKYPRVFLDWPFAEDGTDVLARLCAAVRADAGSGVLEDMPVSSGRLPQADIRARSKLVGLLHEIAPDANRAYLYASLLEFVGATLRLAAVVLRDFKTQTDLEAAGKVERAAMTMRAGARAFCWQQKPARRPFVALVATP